MSQPVQKITIETRTVVRILLLITAFVVGVWLISILHRELVWIGVAFFLAVALDPAVAWINRVLHTGRLLATTIVFTVFVAIVGFVGATLVPPFINQTEALAGQIPHYLQHAESSHSYVGYIIQHYNLVDRARLVQAHFLEDVTAGTGTALAVLEGIFNGLTAGITTLVLTFFMLLEGPHWVTMGWRYVPVSEQSLYHRLSLKMYKVISGYMNGNLIIAGAVAIITAGVIALLGVPYAIPLGIFSGLTTLIPIIGGILGLVVICGVALFTSTTASIILAIFFAVYIFVDSHVLRPIVYGKTIDISPLLVMIAIVLGTAMGGIIGALVAIPIAACLGILFTELVDGHGLHEDHQLKKSVSKS